MSELSLTQIPSGGWQFYQPQTQWWAPNPIANTYGQQVNNIIKHRQANPAVVVKHNLSLDPAVVGNELVTFTRARLNMGPAISPKMTPPPAQPQMSGAVRGAVAAVKKLAEGAALLLEWEQSGLPPEPKEVSEARALICSDCPKNDKGKSLSEFFTVPVSERMRKQFQKLHELNLTTTHDEKLNVCQACLCPLKLKVHTPMGLIQSRLKPEMRAELDPRCWILKAQ